MPALALGAGAAADPAAPYEPTYFNASEWMFVVAAVDRLIPADAAGPGAVEAGVPEFIDRQMNTEYGHGGFWYLDGPFDPSAPVTLGYQEKYNPRDLYRAAIADMDAWCHKNHGAPFAQLTGAAQDGILSALEHGKIMLPSMKGTVFFTQLLANTKEGYFADPMYGGNRGMAAWKMIGFPGARADYADWIKHPDERYPLGPVSIQGEEAAP